MRKTIAVLGLGIFGTTVARELSKFDCDVMVIDNEATHVQAIADEVETAIIGDFTNFEFLQTTGLQQCDIVIVATGDNLESSVLAIMHSKKLNISKIIAKAKTPTYEAVLYEIGADYVIMPERQAGKQLASRILRNQIEEVLRLDDETAIIEFKIPKEWVGRSIEQLDIRRQYDLNIIGERNITTGKLDTSISIHDALEEDKILVAIASNQTFERFDYLNRFK